MSRLDLIIFGATGFTGKHAVKELVRVTKTEQLSWGIAGRSEEKLKTILKEIENKTGEELSKVKIIISDVGSDDSLKKMAEQTKILVNCCGPYRFYGEPVVKACIESKTHYVDVSGEPQFIELMQLKYSKAASDAGVYIISACGFDSIPNDMGVMFLKQKFGGELNAVESYLRSHIPAEHRGFGKPSINFGTWESLVYSISHHNELKPLRKSIYPEPLPPFLPKLKPRSVIHKNDFNKWSLPFPGADGSIVYRTQRYLYEHEKQRPVQFKAYFECKSLFMTLMMTFGAVVLYLMSMTKITRRMLLKYPGIFSMGMVSHEGPSEEVMNNTTFTFKLKGYGWDSTVANIDDTKPNKVVTAEVKGVNPGYGATVTALIFSALTLLKEQNKLPPSGGVYTTGAAFHKTSLIDKLNQNNLTFQIVDTKVE